MARFTADIISVKGDLIKKLAVLYIIDGANKALLAHQIYELLCAPIKLCCRNEAGMF